MGIGYIEFQNNSKSKDGQPIQPIMPRIEAPAPAPTPIPVQPALQPKKQNPTPRGNGC